MLESTFSFLNWAALALAAITGVLFASDKKVDLVGALSLGILNALGGGTLRDLLLGRSVFWISEPHCFSWVLSWSVLTFLVIRKRSLHAEVFLIPDAIGLAMFSLTGTVIALRHGSPLLIAALMGTLTAIGGGALRDLAAREFPQVFQPGTLYASASFTGGCIYAILAPHLKAAPLSIVTISIVLGLRLGSCRWNWTLPRLQQERSTPQS